mgnify:CR=1 FL=1
MKCYSLFGDSMKRLFISKKRRRKGRILFFLFMVILGILFSYQKLEKSRIKVTNKEFVQYITKYAFQEDRFLDRVVEKTLQISNPVKLMNQNYQKYLSMTVPVESKESFTPIIYLYNTHQTEEYAPSTYAEFSVNPTVIMNNYILEDIFNKNGYLTVVEEESVPNILKEKGWNYAGSYKASRILMEKKKETYPSLKYFIDIHRDSLEKEKTTITIEGKDYAKILFIVGLENPKYSENLEFTERIHQKMNEYYPELSKGIYQKSGYGVNGIYNQDFSPTTILIEIGGYENTTVEILNSSLAFARCFMEVIHE